MFGDRVPAISVGAVLLAFGADPRLPGPDGWTPMDLAVHYGHDLAVELLRRHVGGLGDAQADEGADEPEKAGERLAPRS